MKKILLVTLVAFISQSAFALKIKFSHGPFYGKIYSFDEKIVKVRDAKGKIHKLSRVEVERNVKIADGNEVMLIAKNTIITSGI
jgi:hypothetical protein